MNSILKYIIGWIVGDKTEDLGFGYLRIKRLETNKKYLAIPKSMSVEESLEHFVNADIIPFVNTAKTIQKIETDKGSIYISKSRVKLGEYIRINGFIIRISNGFMEEHKNEEDNFIVPILRNLKKELNIEDVIEKE